MNEWIDTNMDGIALLLWSALCALIVLAVAWLFERRLRPRHEREFPHVANLDRYRRRARGHDEYAPRRWL